MTRDPVVVVGAGGIGASVAYHLARRGKPVLLADRRTPVSQTSPRAAGIGMRVHANDAASALGSSSLAMLERFEADVGEPLTVWRSGSLKVAYGDALADQVRREVEFAQRAGYAAGLINPAQASRLAPFLVAGSAAAIGYVEDDVQFEPAELPRAYLRAGRRLGVEISVGTDVVGIESSPEGATAVNTNQGRIPASAVVLAAGGWTPRLTKALGVFVPVVPMRHQLFTTMPIKGIDDSQPTVRVIDFNAYARPYQRGLMFGAYEPDPVAIDTAAVGADHDIQDVPTDLARLRRSAQDVARSIPALRDAAIRDVRAGLPTMTVDGRYIIDQLPECPDVYVVTGCCVTGLHTSPAVGDLLSRWIVSGQRPDELAPFGLDRFDASLRSPERLLAAARAEYEHKYQVFQETPQ